MKQYNNTNKIIYFFINFCMEKKIVLSLTWEPKINEKNTLF